MRKILNEKQNEGKQKIIDEYLAKKRLVREKVRVYNPARAEYLVGEYERLKQQIGDVSCEIRKKNTFR